MSTQSVVPADDRMLINYNLLPIFYLCLSLPLALIYSLLIPPFQVPDEYVHYYYASSVSTGRILPQLREGGQAGARLPKSSHMLATKFNNISGHAEVAVERSQYAGASGITNGSERLFINFGPAAIYSPSGYLVSGSGLAIARQLGLSPLKSFYAGRVANAVVAVGLFALAIAIAPCGRLLLALILSMPSTLTQAASYSADGAAIATTALACALLARASRDQNQGLSMAILSVCLVVVAATLKPPMAALAIVVLAVNAYRGILTAAILFLASLVPEVLWVLSRLSIKLPAPDIDGRPISASQQLHTILDGSTSLFSLLSTTLKSSGYAYLQGIIGVFGWLDTYMESWFYTLGITVVALLAFVTAIEDFKTPLASRIVFLIAATAATGATFAALYLTFTPVGYAIVLGVQGRYFLPIIIVLVFAVAGLAHWRTNPIIMRAAFVTWLTFFSVGAAHSTMTIVHRFYLR